LPSSLTRGLPSTLVCSTCRPVSVCGTGTGSLARGFSWQFGLNPLGLADAAPDRHASGLGTGICRRTLPTRLDGGHPPLGLPPCVPPSLITLPSGTGILTRCPSPTACTLGLGPTHPQLMTIAAEPCDIRWSCFAQLSRYSYRHSLSWPLQAAFQHPFTADHDAPLPLMLPSTRGVGGGLEPRTLSARGHTRPVSYYALFQGWLLLSQPPGCLRARTSLPT
jgi:hypothetical protein